MLYTPLELWGESTINAQNHRDFGADQRSSDFLVCAFYTKCINLLEVDEAIACHWSNLSRTSIRRQTRKDTGKPRISGVFTASFRFALQAEFRSSCEIA